MEPLRAWTEDGSLEPVVSATFPLERGADAHRCLAGRKTVGKVVLTP